MTDHSPATSLCVSHVELYVADAEAAASAFVDGYGFQVCATAERGAGLEGSSRSARPTSSWCRRPGARRHPPCRAFVARQGNGGAGIVLSAADAREFFADAVSCSAVPADDAEDAVDVGRVQADRGLVQDVQDAGGAVADRAGQRRRSSPTCCHPRGTERNPRGATSPLLHK
ncbi:hypothetical protein [Streptomyces sp. MH13]|uniref:hypothetical protein n=1 Tax=Streptomyces sp. MH13 TaxID=3417651 RepID=UPI003CE8A741